MIAFEARLSRGAFTLDVNFSTRAKVTALFGPSGSGKSTIIDILAGLLRPDSGRIVVGGEPLLDTGGHVFVPPHKRRVAVVFQDAQLFPHLTVRQNLAFGRWFTPRALRRVDPAPVIETLGIGGLLDRRPRSLSGGERQRVGFARALLASPSLLLMDEPLASLDMIRRFEILRLIEQIRDTTGIPILYVSHSVDEVSQIAEDVIVIEAGRIVAQGPPAQAFAAARHLVENRRFGLSSPLVCQVESYDPELDVTVLSHPAGAVPVAGDAGPPGREVRLLIRATDVTIALVRPERLSIRITLSGTIETVEGEGGPLVLVGVRLAGGELLRASITRLAARDLALSPGMPVFCLVKSAALDERSLGHPTSGERRSVT